MSTQRPDHLRPAGDPDDGAAMESFTVPLPRRLSSRLFGRNPLIRASDRLEALTLVLAVAISLVAVPIGAAVGTAVHESSSRVHAEQAQAHRQVTATSTGDSHPRRALDSPTVTVPARWSVDGTEHSGDVTAPLNVKPGDKIEIWVDGSGAPVRPPVRTAVDEGVAFAAATWSTVSLLAVGLFGVVRIALDRSRYARWQRDFDNLVGHR
ncbi:hypothetical protein JF781_08080 [Mycobacterium sp. WUMAC-067]|uniref:Rv1733c family protein n=1 Tax=unclassified Mycobacterium TaxID=2642494 RepID=UPI001CD96BC4|nr:MULTISPECIES: hypothetical protein [unclassified Mycobacterium]MCA2242315.1 hypothetical protein [Mycobacterium sp. WUMAC-067]MCA2313650.1 hypothetical protein [Mycobacterium sp. WUMAC-025]